MGYYQMPMTVEGAKEAQQKIGGESEVLRMSEDAPIYDLAKAMSPEAQPGMLLCKDDEAYAHAQDLGFSGSPLDGAEDPFLDFFESV